MMSKAVIEINRSKVGDGNHVFLHMDTICKQENLPKADIVFLTTHDQPHLSRRYIPGSKGIHLILPIPLIPFLSFQEIQMVVYWSFLNSNPISCSAMGEFLTRYRYEDALGVLAKTESVLALWSFFLSTDDYLGLVKKTPQDILFAFAAILMSEMMIVVSKNTFEKNKIIERLLKELNKEQILTFIDNAVLLKENQVFSLRDPEFIQITGELLYEIEQDKNQDG